MEINGVNISVYDATLIDKNISPNKVSSFLKWEARVDEAYQFDSFLDFKDIYIQLLVRGTEYTFHRTLGNLTEQFRLGAEIKFSDVPGITYTCFIQEKAEYEKLNNGWYKVNFNVLCDYGLGSKTTVSESSAVSALMVQNHGLYATPVKLTIQLPVIASPFMIHGLTEDIGIESTTRNNTQIVIDTLTGEVTVDGINAISKYVGFSFPRLLTGVTNMTFSHPCVPKVEFRERY